MGANVWAVTPTLTENYSVNGYNKKAYYNLASSNVDDMCPTSGDARYRDSYGFFNFGSGNRGGDITISVSEGDLIIFEAHQNQSYADAINSVSSCTKNATLSTGSYWAYDVTSNATSLTVNISRAEYICAILVMEKDNSVKTGNYSINYKTGETTVKTVSGTDVAVGTEIPVLSSFTEAGIKYITDDGQVSSLTIAEGENNLNITVTEATKYTCTVNAKAGDVLLATEEESVYDGEDVTIYYQMAYAKDGKWYFIDKNGSAPGYGVAFNSVTSNQVENKTTYTLNEGVVDFEEAENMTLSGSFAADGNYLTWRSNGGAKRLAVGAYIYSNVIAPGVYDVTLWARNNRSAGDGTETLPIFLRDEDGNLTDLEVSFPGWNRGGFEDAKTATITIPDDGKSYSVVINNNTAYNSNLELDYLYITNKKVPVTVSEYGYATFVSPYALDYSSATEIEAYTVKVETQGKATVYPVTQVPANAPVLLYVEDATKDITEDIPVIASAAALENNDLVAGTGAAVATEDGDYTNMILWRDETNPIGFYFANDQEVATNRAYLHFASSLAPAANAPMVIQFSDEVTGIEQVNAAESATGCFNLAGQRVAKATKGLYILNGKKVLVK